MVIGTCRISFPPPPQHRGVLSAASCSFTCHILHRDEGHCWYISSFHTCNKHILGPLVFHYSLYDCAVVSWTTAICKLDVPPTLYFLNTSLIFKGWSSMSQFVPFSPVFLMHPTLTFDNKRMLKVFHSKGSWDKMPIWPLVATAGAHNNWCVSGPQSEVCSLSFTYTRSSSPARTSQERGEKLGWGKHRLWEEIRSSKAGLWGFMRKPFSTM